MFWWFTDGFHWAWEGLDLHQTKEVERSTSTNQTQVTPHQTVGQAVKFTTSSEWAAPHSVKLFDVQIVFHSDMLLLEKNEQIGCEHLGVLLRTHFFLDSETDPRPAPNLADDKSDGTFLRVADMCPSAS